MTGGGVPRRVGGMSANVPAVERYAVPKDSRFAVVAARFNAHLVDDLLSGCLRRFAELGIERHRVDAHRVPGAFELPVAAKVLARTGQYAAVVCLGAVVRGDTPHFDYVAGEAARGIQDVALSESIPVIFGVLTTNTEQQAVDRIGGAHGHAGELAPPTPPPRWRRWWRTWRVDRCDLYRRPGEPDKRIKSPGRGGLALNG